MAKAKVDDQGAQDGGAEQPASADVLPDLPELPRYRSHKVVRAAAILEVTGQDLRLDLGGGAFQTQRAADGMFARYTPVPGDYYVVYEPDGYASISPKAKFEDGYSLIRSDEPVPPGQDHRAVLEALRASYDPADLDVAEGAGVTTVKRYSAAYVPALELAHDVRHDPLAAIAALRDHGPKHPYGRVAALALAALLALAAPGAIAQTRGTPVTTESAMPTYSAAFTGLVPQSSGATDVLQLNGDGTKTIRLLAMEITARAGANIPVEFTLVRRSALDTGGTSGTVTATKHETSQGTSVATVTTFTGNPTTGASDGVVRARLQTLGVTAVPALTLDFTRDNSKAPVLRLSTEALAVNLGGAAFTGTLDGWLMWREE